MARYGSFEIPHSGQVQLVASSADAQDVALIMVELVRKLALYDSTTFNLAVDSYRTLTCGDLVCDLAMHIYDRAKFSPDREYQTIRTPQRLIRDAMANCVDYTVTLAAMATVLGLPVKIRIVKFAYDEPYTHVYPIIDGVVADLCIGQMSLQTHGVRNPVPTVGVEVPSVLTKDFAI